MSPAPRSYNSKYLYWAILAALALLAFIPRAYLASKYGLWTDEIGAINSFIRANSFSTYLRHHLFDDTVPPLYNMVSYPLVKLWPESELAFRFPAILFSTVTVIVMGALARTITHSRTTAIAAAVLAAITPIAVRYGHDARPYSMEVFFITLLWYQLHRQSDRAWNRISIAAFILTLVLTCAAHYFAMVPVGLLVGGYLVLPWIRRSATTARPPVSLLIAASIVLCAAAVTYLWMFSLHSHSRTNHFSDYTPAFLWKYFGMLWQTDIPGAFTPTIRQITLLPFNILVLAATGAYGLRKDVRVLIQLTAILVAIFAIPLLAIVTRNLLSVRFSIFALPALILATSHGLGMLITFALHKNQTTLLSITGRLVATILAVATTLVILADARAYLQQPYFHEWREKARYYDSLVQRDAIDQGFAGNNIIARNINFYASNPVQTFNPDSLRPKPNEPAPRIAFFDVNRTSALDAYKEAFTTHTAIQLSGVVPPVILTYPGEMDLAQQLDMTLLEYVHLHRHVLPERRPGIYSQLGQVATRSKNAPLKELAFQLAFLHANTDADRGYALWQLGSDRTALQYYERYFENTADYKIHDYTRTQYNELKGKLSR